ncbi:MAG: hypothetical protein U1E53_00615 [Dongiaceae bacterium]
MRLPRPSPGAVRAASGSPPQCNVGPSGSLAGRGRPAQPLLPVPWLPIWIAAKCTVFSSMICCPCGGGSGYSGVCCHPRH